MVRVTAGRFQAWWFGVVWSGDDLVATARGSSREDALSRVLQGMPKGMTTNIEDSLSSFTAGIVAMLGDLERGIEDSKRFSLSEEHLTAPLRRILTVAAAIPIGYVTSYGNIARAANTVARAVGRAMATNPLYPIVPCHRVVGADMSLVGYGGKQDQRALNAKLERLKAEVRGADGDECIAVLDSTLTVYPTEGVIEAALAIEEKKRTVAGEKAADEEAERLQLKLF